MTTIKRTLATFAAAATVATVATGVAAAPAQADASTENVDIWHIENAGPIKPNASNPNPVCNPWSQCRTHITSVKTSFTPMGAVQTTNDSDSSVPLTQTLSSTQTLTMKIDGDFGRSFTAGLTGSGSKDGITGGGNLAATWTQAIKPGFSYEASWTTGQEIGPYDIKPGMVGRATYGFNTVTFKGTQQYCKLNGTWSQPTPLSGTAPIAKDVHIEQYKIGSLPKNRY